ncbi:MAG: hypothetical protein ACRYFK_01220 [Janthinobacterium lividum]
MRWDPTADTPVLAYYARHLLAKLWEPGTVYHKAGVVLDGLEPPSNRQQLGLFAAPVAVAVLPALVLVSKRAALVAQVDRLNACYGCGMVRLGSAVTEVVG